MHCEQINVVVKVVFYNYFSMVEANPSVASAWLLYLGTLYMDATHKVVFD
jgi:hypothetical protein